MGMGMGLNRGVVSTRVPLPPVVRHQITANMPAVKNSDTNMAGMFTGPRSGLLPWTSGPWCTRGFMSNTKDGAAKAGINCNPGEVSLVRRKLASSAYTSSRVEFLPSLVGMDVLRTNRKPVAPCHAPNNLAMSSLITNATMVTVVGTRSFSHTTPPTRCCLTNLT